MRSSLGITIGLLLGLVFGLLAAATGSPSMMRVVGALDPIGTTFVNLVRMVVVPLVATTVFTGVARLGDVRKLGRLGVLTVLCFWVATLAAIVMGVTVMSAALAVAPPSIVPGSAAQVVEKLPGVKDFLISLIPVNPVDAAAKGQLLPLIVFTVLFGAAASTLAAAAREQLITIADAITNAMVRLVHWILVLAPFGVFALAAAVTAKSGWAMLQNLAMFIAAVIAGLLAFYAVVYLPAVRVLGGISPARFARACVAPVALAFSTTSSAASLPALFDSAKELELAPEVSGFVLSLGAAINRAGSALFQGAAIIFLASVYGVHIPPTALASAIGAIFLMSQTVASVPSAGVVTLAPILSSLGIPVSALGLLLGVDRIPDMARTATQVTGHLATACVVDRSVKQRSANQPPVRSSSATF